MNPTIAQFDAAHQPLTTLLDAVPAPSWAKPSPCDGWSARDVLRHMIQTQRDFLTGHNLDLGGVPDVDADPAAAWRDHATRVLAALADDTVPATPYDGYFGPTTVGDTLGQFYVWDMLVHRWDIARSVSEETEFTDSEIEQIERGADSFGEGLYLEGVCKTGVQAPAGADRGVRALARLGRTA